MPMKSCLGCGFTRNTNPTSDYCVKCRTVNLQKHFRDDYTNRLQESNFSVIAFKDSKGVHGKIEVKNLECGHIFTAKLNNILNGATKCGVCGPTKRVAVALKGYVEKYGRTYDLRKWRDFLGMTRHLSEKYYWANQDTMNPNGLVRTRADLHTDAVNLDHIIPIIYGFKNDLSVEMMADPRNLRLMPARANLSKKQKLTDEAEKLLEKLKIYHN